MNGSLIKAAIYTGCVQYAKNDSVLTFLPSVCSLSMAVLTSLAYNEPAVAGSLY